MLAITTTGCRNDMLSLLKTRGNKIPLDPKIHQLPYPYDRVDGGVSKEVVSHAVLTIAERIKETEETIVLDVPTLFNVIRQLHEEEKGLGIVDALTEARVAFLTYNEKFEYSQITSDIDEAIRLEEHFEDMEDIGFLVLEDGNEIYSTNDLIMSIKELNENNSLGFVKSEYGLSFPVLSSNQDKEVKKIPLPFLEEVRKVSGEDAWNTIQGLVGTKEIIYIHKSLWEKHPGLSILSSKYPGKTVII